MEKPDDKNNVRPIPPLVTGKHWKQYENLITNSKYYEQSMY